MTTTSEKSTLQVLLEELINVYRPLAALETLEDILERMAISGEIPKAVDDLREAAGNLESGDLQSGMQALTDFYQSIQDLKDLPPEYENFSRRLNDYLIADYLRAHHTAFYHVSSMLGWVRFTPDQAPDTNTPVYASEPVSWGDLPAFFTDTAAVYPEAGHGWSKPTFADQYTFLFYHLGEWLNRLNGSGGFPVTGTSLEEDGELSTLYIPFLSTEVPVTDEQGGAVSAEFGVRLALVESNGAFGVKITPEGSAELDVEFKLPSPGASGLLLFLLLEMGISLEGGVSLNILPDEVSLKQEDTEIEAHVLTGLRVEKADRILLLGSDTGNRMDLKSFAGKTGLRIATGSRLEFIGELVLSEGRIIIKNTGGDGFLAKLLPKDGIEAQFDLTVGWSSEQGIYFSGSAGLEVKFPAHIDLGPIEIHGINIGVKPETSNDQPPGFDVALGLDAQLLLGPFTAVVQDMGIRTFISYRASGGNLGPLNFDIDFKPPKGIGLALETPTIKGGGYLFLDFDKGEYAGVAELVIKNLVAVKAIGIITTKKPDGSPGFSFLLIITAEFKPIQLGFGFTLNGVGGLIAINRGMNLEALAEGVRTNAINAVMFPDDPIAEAPRIIADLNQFFPIAEGRYTFGLMAIIGWGTPTLIAVELGLIIQVPDPVILAIIGVVRVELPDKAAPVVSLQVNFIGAVDFEQEYMFFFAAMYGSRLAQYTIEGEMYFSLSWGDRPNFLFTVGGFHPAFKPPPLRNLSGQLKRITINLLPSDNPRLTVQAYFAVTPNTVQFGASVDFYFKVSKFRVVGYLYLDALFQFNPFYFIVDIGAGLSVMLGGSELMGIHLKGSLTGPTPWRIKGTASFKVLFVKVKVRVSKRFGDDKKKILPPRPILPALLEVLRDVRNWQADLPQSAELQVSFREIPEEELVLHPAGILSISQNRLPLNFRLQKLGNERTSDYTSFSFRIDQYSDADQLKDFFAPAEYLTLSDSERLSRKSFERMQSGLAVQGGDAFFSVDEEEQVYVGRDYEFEQLILDGPDFFANQPGDQLVLEQDEFESFVQGNAVSRSPQGRRNALKTKAADLPVKQKEEQYGIVAKDDLHIVEMDATRLLYGSEAEARQVLRAIEIAKPQLTHRFQVLPAYEIPNL